MHHSHHSPSRDDYRNLGLFLACCLAVILLAVFLSGCTTDDPERTRVQAEGTNVMHDAAHVRPAKLDRSQPI